MREGSITFLCTALLLNEFYLPTMFLVKTPCRFRVMSRTTFKSVTKKGNNSKDRQGRVTDFSTALLLNEIYLPAQFEVDIFCRFRVLFRTKFNV